MTKVFFFLGLLYWPRRASEIWFLPAGWPCMAADLTWGFPSQAAAKCSSALTESQAQTPHHCPPWPFSGWWVEDKEGWILETERLPIRNAQRDLVGSSRKIAGRTVQLFSPVTAFTEESSEPWRDSALHGDRTPWLLFLTAFPNLSTAEEGLPSTCLFRHSSGSHLGAGYVLLPTRSALFPLFSALSPRADMGGPYQWATSAVWLIANGAAPQEITGGGGRSVD